jgi:uncharacterized protein
MGQKYQADDARMALRYFSIGCEKNDAKSCKGVAMILDSDRVGPKDEKGAFAAFEKSCTLGELTSCPILAMYYKYGPKFGAVPKDLAKAASILDHACEAGEGVACLDLADYYKTGQGVKADKKKAAALHKRAESLGAAE